MTFPIDFVRSQFPALAITDESRGRIYLDNPAGTQVPESVAHAVANCLIHSNANLGGYFASSRRADAVVAAAHEAMADFLGAGSADEIIIGANMTSLTFHLSRSICRDLQPGDEIIVTRMDHEGNVSPWLEIAAEKDLVVRWLSFDEKRWRIDESALGDLLNERTRLVALGYASNVLGTINDIKALTRKAKTVGATVFVDAVQFAPHGLIDVQDLGCDFLACSSYKFFGPHLGILWGRRELLQSMHAFKCRCVSDGLPGKYETGTPQIELQAGLTAAVDYFAGLGAEGGASGSRRDRIAAGFAMTEAYEQALAMRLIVGLQGISGITVYGITDRASAAGRVPTVVFRHSNSTPAAVARALGEQGIFVWNGHNYALETTRQLGVPEDEGMVRIGIAHYNTAAEIDAAIAAVTAAV